MECLSLNAYPPVLFCCALLQRYNRILTWRGRGQQPNADGSLGHGVWGHARQKFFKVSEVDSFWHWQLKLSGVSCATRKYHWQWYFLVCVSGGVSGMNLVQLVTKRKDHVRIQGDGANNPKTTEKGTALTCIRCINVPIRLCSLFVLMQSLSTP